MAQIPALPGRLFRTARRQSRQIQALRAAARLRRGHEPAGRAVGAAVESMIRGQASAAEAAWIARLEELRRVLGASSEQIECRESEFTGNPAHDELLVEQVGELSRRASKPPMWAYLLFCLVRERRPERALELGTCLGLSAAHQAAALEINGTGRIVTLEAAASRAALAAKNLEHLGLGHRAEVVHGRFQDTLPGVLEDFDGPVAYAFIDGHHDEQATLAYFEQLLPSLAEGSVVVFDDVAWSPGMIRAWRSLQRHPRAAASVDLGNIGICTIGEGSGRQTAQIRLDAQGWRSPGAT